jgi:hypothetical protein
MVICRILGSSSGDVHEDKTCIERLGLDDIENMRGSKTVEEGLYKSEEVLQASNSLVECNYRSVNGREQRPGERDGVDIPPITISNDCGTGVTQKPPDIETPEPLSIL